MALRAARAPRPQARAFRRTLLSRRDSRQHKRAITTAGEHDISCRNHNKNIPCGLLVRDKTQSRGVVWCFSDLHPTATARDDQICVWLAESRRAQRPGRGDRASATSPFVFGPSDSESRAVTSKAEPPVKQTGSGRNRNRTAVPVFSSRTRWTRTRGSSLFFGLWNRWNCRPPHLNTTTLLPAGSACVASVYRRPGHRRGVFVANRASGAQKSAPFLCFVGVPVRYLAVCVFHCGVLHTHQRTREELDRTRSSADLRKTRPTRTRGFFRL